MYTHTYFTYMLIEIKIYMYMYNYVQRRVKSSGSVPGEISSRPNEKGWRGGGGKRWPKTIERNHGSVRLSHDERSLITFIATCAFLFFSFFRGTRFRLAAGLVRTSCMCAYVCCVCVRARARACPRILIYY